MATRLQQLLRSLCSSTEWDYAVFWKLRHCVPMVLACEDAYYCNRFEHNTSETKSFSDVLETWHDGLLAHDPIGLAVAKISYHVYSHGEGIVGQVAVTGNHRWIFAGDHPMDSLPSPELYDGWQTQLSVGIKTIVVAAVPHGVVQLGSLIKVNEDLKLLAHIRNLFSSLQDSSTRHVQIPFQYSKRIAMQQMSDTSTTTLHPDTLQKYILGLEKSRRSLVDNFESPACDTAVVEDDDYPSEEKLRKLVASDPPKTQVEKSAKIQPQCELYEAPGHYFLRQCYPLSCEAEYTEDRSTSNIPEIMESSMLTSDSASDNLLETATAKSCPQDASVKNTVSFSSSESMLTTEKDPEPYLNSSHTVGSPCYSIDRSSVQKESQHDCLKSSDSCCVRSSTSVCREPMVRTNEPGKSNKKRARSGRSSHPQPRDRQLIEDRIKQLREIVPNGSKCSIDSLLERTIKHMVFLQNATTKADKLNYCAKSRGCSNETRMPGADCEQGSCWAVELGSDMKICPIVVENLNTNGQMLIKMLCEDCHNFLEIAEVIRSLGLTILKGLTENRGDKIWMRFVVEGKGNGVPHRTQVLWSLLQLLQFETTA